MLAALMLAVTTAVPVIHETDLFRPHGDPDDHWDLAVEFALAQRGDIDLKAIFLDYAPSNRRGDPDVEAVAQLGWLTGVSVPFGIGQRGDATMPRSGLKLLKRTLEESADPVVIHITGSSHDLALAAELWPDLIRTKVKAVYLNAGAAEERNGELEYNVKLDPLSYSKMFALPCPVYWVPCWQYCQNGAGVAGVHGSFYTFRQGKVFEVMSDPAVNFFISMLDERQEAFWLGYLNQPVNASKRTSWGNQDRRMWSTIGFLHAAGLTILKDGTVEQSGLNPGEEIFRFVPITVSCATDGTVAWSETTAASNRWILEITDTSKYNAAMTAALRQLLNDL